MYIKHSLQNSTPRWREE